MKDFMLMFNINWWRVTGFYPYTSSILCAILEQNHNYKTEEHDFLDTIGAKVQELAEAKGCHMDNKVVIEITQQDTHNTEVPAKLYLSWYDGKWRLGVGVYQDSWLKDSNKHFD